MTTVSSQISKTQRDAMDSLTEDDLVSEITLDKKSRFPKNIPYLQARLIKIHAEEKENSREEDLAIARESIRLSDKANRISADANRLSKRAIGIAMAAFIVSLIAIGYQIIKTAN